MGLAEEIEKLKFDKRLMQWHISRGKLPKEEAQKHLDALPDLAHNVEQFGFPEDRGEREEQAD